ncbi:MAG: hypothetical protein ACFFAO_13370 [Candidatus Hermodarchaeota archaeon]
MDFTFGIITGGNNESNINLIIDSIEKENIKNYEIIIVGSCLIERKNVKIISFDESIKRAWITKKKNLITENAKYENIVYMHDYIVFCNGWYEGFKTFGNDFKVCMNQIININGTRYRDWTLWPTHISIDFSKILPDRRYLLPYNELDLSKYMYISGA